MTKIYVVSFAPADDLHGAGGFEWAWEREEAEKVYDQMIEEGKDDDGYILRLLEVETVLDDELEIGHWLNGEYIDEIEAFLDPIRQHIPEHTPEDRKPKYEGNI